MNFNVEQGRTRERKRRREAKLFLRKILLITYDALILYIYNIMLRKLQNYELKQSKGDTNFRNSENKRILR